MNFGCLLTEASQAPKNLKHFVIDNQVYQTVGALPMVNQNRTDYAAIARGAGIPRARTIETLDGLEKAMPSIVADDGPSFTLLRVEAEHELSRTPPMTYEGPEMKYRFGRYRNASASQCSGRRVIEAELSSPLASVMLPGHEGSYSIALRGGLIADIAPTARSNRSQRARPPRLGQSARPR